MSNVKEAYCKTKNIRISPRKMGVLADTIRNCRVNNAINILSFSKKSKSKLLLGVLNSAVSNAENNHNMDADSLFIKRVDVGKGLVLKRFKARARGRGAKILKPFSTVRVVVSEINKESNNGTKG